MNPPPTHTPAERLQATKRKLTARSRCRIRFILQLGSYLRAGDFQLTIYRNLYHPPLIKKRITKGGRHNVLFPFSPLTAGNRTQNEPPHKSQKCTKFDTSLVFCFLFFLSRSHFRVTCLCLSCVVQWAVDPLPTRPMTEHLTSEGGSEVRLLQLWRSTPRYRRS